MRELVAMQSDRHQSRLPTDEAPTAFLLHVALYFLVDAIAASGMLEGEAHCMRPQSAHTAGMEGIAQLVVVRETDRAGSGQLQFAPSLGLPLLDKGSQLICAAKVAVGIHSPGLAVLLEPEIVQRVDDIPPKGVGKVFLYQQSGIFFLGIVILLFWLLGYFGRDRGKHFCELTSPL